MGSLNTGLGRKSTIVRTGRTTITADRFWAVGGLSTVTVVDKLRAAEVYWNCRTVWKATDDKQDDGRDQSTEQQFL